MCAKSRNAAIQEMLYSPNWGERPQLGFRAHGSGRILGRVSSEDSLLERWTKLADVVLAHGVATEAHIGEMTALARSEQDYIKRKLRRTAKAFRQGHRSIKIPHGV